MGGRARTIRNSAKAIIIQEGRILAIKAEDEKGDWYLLPGGGQEPHESLEETLIRECIEEAGVTVEMGPLRFIREYFSANHEFAAVDGDAHQVEFMFLCTLARGQTPHVGSVPDKGQKGVEWLELSRIEEYRLYPLTMRRCFRDVGNGSFPVYMGDIN
jgi:8-oxo-dGTP diphosphatase